MKIYCKIDKETGVFLEDVVYEQEIFTDENGIETIKPVPDDLIPSQPVGLHKPRWDGAKWVESLTDIEMLAIKKASAQAKVIAKFNKTMSQLAGKYSDYERETWPEQKSEAMLYLSDNSAVTPMLTSIANERGMTVSDLATSIILKSVEFSSQSGAAIGRLKKSIKSIDAATTIDELINLL